MKYFKAKKGPVKKQPFFSLDEIEEICTTELRKVELLPMDPESIRIDRFIEKRFGNILEYEDLGDKILGYSHFGPSGVNKIAISKLLDEDGNIPAERRLRTTLAHECGHCLLHAHLFVDGLPAKNLFGEDSNGEAKIFCRDIVGVSSDAENKGYKGNWWEYQANKAMSALLMPRVLVYKAIQPYLVKSGFLQAPKLKESERVRAEKELANIFNVNPIVVRIKLTELFPVIVDAQMTF
ncbi:MAG: hypothetical protein WC244_04055 [Patescibacteria group bacterium]|jgi:hypothetical protein